MSPHDTMRREAHSWEHKPPLVSIVTPTLPGREHYLRECAWSVESQTHRNVEHIIQADRLGEGCAVTTNKAVAKANGEYLVYLCDDDILLPRYLELLLAHADNAVDKSALVVYSPPLVWGEEPAGLCGAPPTIPATALVNLDYWRRMGGYDERLQRAEDNALWNKMNENGCTWLRYDAEPTWVYRFHLLPDGTSGNKSRRQVPNQ